MEFGEYALDTVHREFREEIGQALTGVLAGVLENSDLADARDRLPAPLSRRCGRYLGPGSHPAQGLGRRHFSQANKHLAEDRQERDHPDAAPRSGTGPADIAASRFG